ncbi:EamA family transporter [Hyphobacterium sp. SN044]|uniref:DMT family transporter n=1 Tax=Hyphobacterium sp. SN044 TaxID=2912575 RepID=UPI001F007024|nr:EamA family transporter [Hyphobacterium sp. SN044]MCF8878355.1 EamA family transporter [Hyphobacterium sp. SN044]
MTLRDALGLVAMCLIWGFNFVVAKFSIAGIPAWVPGFEGSPPIFFAFLRFLLLAMVLAPFLRPMPKDWPRLLGVAACMGGVQYALIFIGLQSATPSGMAITLQLGVPFATLLSVVWLGERLGPLRVVGTIAAFTGVALVSADPANLTISLGLLFGIGAAAVSAVGMILVKKIDMKPFRLQAWIGVLSIGPLLVLSLLLERGQIAAVMSGGFLFVLALIYTVGLVNMFGHGVFYHLIQRYETNLIAPLTLMAPLSGVAFGILVAGDPLGWRLAVGGAIALAGVALVAARPNKTLPKAPLAREEAL